MALQPRRERARRLRRPRCRRSRAARARRCHRMRARGAQCRVARRSAPTRAGIARLASARDRAFGPRASARAIITPFRRSAACFSHLVPHASGDLRVHLATPCTTAACVRRRQRASTRSRRRTARRGLRYVPVEHAATRRESCEEADAIVAEIDVAAAREVSWSRRAGAADTRRRHPRRLAVQRAARAAFGSKLAARRISGHPRRHGRQVPGPGGAGRVLLDGDVERRGHAARHRVSFRERIASTSRSRARNASACSFARRACSRSAAALPNRWRWSTCCAIFAKGRHLRPALNNLPDRDTARAATGAREG